ncbi:MAG: ntrB: nitrate transporter, permease protein [Massilibacillus sp.]|jgi:NitT/TauT family transport system permease protein|nr:ntrB: nitrate transporter, permease protein [Massilibacillus sp.]
MKNRNVWLPILSGILALVVEDLIGNSSKHTPAKHPYFIYFMIGLIAIFTIIAIISYFNPKLKAWAQENSLFIAAMILFLNVLNIVTKKMALLPVIFFPSLDKVLGVIIEDWAFLATCLAASGKLLFTGCIFGAIAGFVTGIGVGFSKSAAYWVNPLIRILGPIPPTAWIPLVLISFPTTFSGSSFLIALAVWFPTAVMTSSGILNVQNAYFEVSSTLGAGKYYQIFKVGIPAAMPHMFIGLFNGTCASFITLMTAEMLGVKNGIGWYINWQKDMMAYANVYAGLIIIAVTFYILITLLFKVRDYLLVWQKGVIKW